MLSRLTALAPNAMEKAKVSGACGRREYLRAAGGVYHLLIRTPGRKIQFVATLP